MCNSAGPTDCEDGASVGRFHLAAGVVHCGLPGHRDRKGLRRERGERVILHFIFHDCQPFVMTLASTLYIYAALGLNMCMCVCEHVCVCEVYTGKA